MSYFIAAQLVGVLTAVVSIIIVQFKKIRWILVGEVFSNLLISVSYALVGGWLLNGQSRILCKPKIQLQNDDIIYGTQRYSNDNEYLCRR